MEMVVLNRYYIVFMCEHVTLLTSIEQTVPKPAAGVGANMLPESYDSVLAVMSLTSLAAIRAP